MTFHDRIDPEYQTPLAALSRLVPAALWEADVVTRRKTGEAMNAAAQQTPTRSVTWQDRTVPGPSGSPDVPVRCYHPVQASTSRPGLFVIHGGGMWGGSVASEHPQAVKLCEDLGAVVVSVEYRLAPEHPHPAPVQDCYAALSWMWAHAEDLGFDRARLGVYGASAGGGLALAAALMARDLNGPALCHVMALYPMVDDRNETPSSHEFDGLGPVWDRSKNLEAWRWYLGGQQADGYAAPIRTENLRGLPPTFIDVGELDLFRDEDVAFAARLMESGVPTELHVYPGAFHASENVAPQAELSQRILGTRLSAMRRALQTTKQSDPTPVAR